MRRGIFAAAALLAAACAAERAKVEAPSAVTPDAEALPSGPGRDLLRDGCLGCHTEDLLRQQRLTQAQWVKTLDKMHNWGAPTEAEQMETLAAYLAATCGRDTSAYVPQTIAAGEVAALFERLPDAAFANGDPAHGSTLYTERCAPCHAENGHGGALGVGIAGRHVLDRAPEFAAIVRAGRARMPEFREATDAQIADLLTHVRSLPER